MDHRYAIDRSRSETTCPTLGGIADCLLKGVFTVRYEGSMLRRHHQTGSRLAAGTDYRPAYLYTS